MSLCVLKDRQIISVTGADAEHLLHNVLTANIEQLEEGKAQACALLSPQGKVAFAFLVSRSEEGFAIEINQELVADFIKRMTMYRLRAKVDFVVEEEQLVSVSFNVDSTPAGALLDTRFSATNVWRRYGPPSPDNEPSDCEAYDLLRIEHGVIEMGADYDAGSAFGHDVSLDQNGGIDFAKGCYVGQEVVSRMHHRNTARRRVVLLNGQQPITLGAHLTANDRPLGAVGTVVGAKAIGIARLDRVVDAKEAGHPILAGETALDVMLPPGVTYDWPSSDQESEDA